MPKIFLIFFISCMLGSLFLAVRPDIGARWTYDSRKKDWNLTEGSIPYLKFICRWWGVIMVLIFLFVIFKYK